MDHRALCLRCRRPQSVCYCALVPRIPTRTRVVFLQHPRERRMAVGTARMAHLALPNSELRLGVRFEAIAADALLFPGPGARDVSEVGDTLGTLIVIDGTWPLARKVLKENPWLAELPRVAFTPRRPGNYRIRREPAPHCVSTVEAVVEALGGLEGDHGRFEPMLAAFEKMVDWQLEHKAARTGPPRRKLHRRPPRPALPREVREAPERLVVFYGEANAYPKDSVPHHQPELIQWVAERPATGERFEALIAPRAPLAPRIADHIEVPRASLEAGELLQTVRERWAAFGKPGDLLAAWGHFARSVAMEDGFDLNPFLDLRLAAARAWRRRPGELEAHAPRQPPWAPGRAGRRLAALSAIALTLLSGCFFRRLSQDIQRIKHTAFVTGRVSGATGAAPVYVLHYVEWEALPSLDGAEQLPAEVGEYGFFVDPDKRHYFAAFQDLNGDRTWQPGEPLGALTDPLEVEARQQITLDEIALSIAAKPPDRFELKVPPNVTTQALPFARGEVASLDSEVFSEEQTQRGLWEPLTSAEKVGFGVYFLQPHDPAKTPVLFVHGIGGTPRDFRTLIESLDTSRYEAWVVRYPSGIRLPICERVLRETLLEMRDRLRVQRMVVVAHSMGGLVARATILDLAKTHQDGFIQAFVSLSTPYGGHEAAKSGIKHAPQAVPSWIDMAPGSDFLKGLAAPLPKRLLFFLFFGYGSPSAFVQGNNDGTVAVASELAPFAQDDAVRLYGYEQSHMTILASPDVLRQVNGILAELR